MGYNPYLPFKSRRQKSEVRNQKLFKLPYIAASNSSSGTVAKLVAESLIA